MIGKKCILSFLLAALAATAVAKDTTTEDAAKKNVSATKTKDLPNKAAKTSEAAQTPTSGSDGPEYINAVYYPSWYNNSVLNVDDLLSNDITHIIYAFSDVKNGKVAPGNPFDLHDKWTNSNTTSSKTAKGNVEELFKFKNKNRHVKVLLSVGGWNISQTKAFNNAADDTKKFAKSAVDLMIDWGMDGLDIDWEIQPTFNDANQLTQLIHACREALDAKSKELKDGYHYTLSMALQADPDRYDAMSMSFIDKKLDYWFLMGYDYAGTFSHKTAHLANLHKDGRNEDATPFNTQDAYKGFTNAGVSSKKMVLGIPLYGVAFAEPDKKAPDVFGATYKKENITEKGYDTGKWHYKNIPCLSSTSYNAAVVGAWCQDDNGTLYSFDNTISASHKAKWIKENKLAGAMFWEASGDRKSEGSLIKTVSEEFKSLNRTDNWIKYPDSRFDNIKGDSGSKNATGSGKKSGKKVRAALQKDFSI